MTTGHDPYGFADLLDDAERAALARLRAVLDTRVEPLVAEHWERATFPEQIIAPLADLRLMDPPEFGGATDAGHALYRGFRNFELARTDVSVATFYNGQSGLFRTSVELGGSEAQVADLAPRIRSFELRGAFALTEPDHGSDIARGMQATARRDGDDWVIDGRKRWIGGAVLADVIVVFARTEEGVGAFLVPRDAPGLTLTTMTGKIALRIVQNSDIQLVGVRVPESARLARVSTFADVARMLGAMRADVAWIAVGAQAGAYEAAVAYVREREQFGRAIGGFQLVQSKLATMLGNLTASLALVVRLTQRQAAGLSSDEDSALAKMWTAARLRETVALGREVAGGNGILLEHRLARFFADAEAVYSYEGTHEINALIVGRGITGLSAFR
ncbi:acyl-CoA dehydrogenase family protein [Pseudolysinimonas yzui]|uniref:Acyl-CoA dehydrogenase n=1 Tax=Pseudolysinimonas yzui TaxID=2708254 RepID=A0A8J3GRC2_9MICO|nr:acyl-CoA dehydrogenase family protein [Pseudolysinimonas yzui]GHF19273.1 acyl-CoA dehydrogenase [Pseudolysinimonas yzui]